MSMSLIKEAALEYEMMKIAKEAAYEYGMMKRAGATSRIIDAGRAAKAYASRVGPQAYAEVIGAAKKIKPTLGKYRDDLTGTRLKSLLKREGVLLGNEGALKDSLVGGSASGAHTKLRALRKELGRVQNQVKSEQVLTRDARMLAADVLGGGALASGAAYGSKKLYDYHQDEVSRREAAEAALEAERNSFGGKLNTAYDDISNYLSDLY